MGNLVENAGALGAEEEEGWTPDSEDVETGICPECGEEAFHTTYHVDGRVSAACGACGYIDDTPDEEAYS